MKPVGANESRDIGPVVDDERGTGVGAQGAELEAELDTDDGVVDDRVRAEMGDILFVMANLARHLGVEPETALQQTNATFMRRFQAMEDHARETGRDFRQMDLEEQDALWNEVKAEEGGEPPSSVLKR